MSRIERLLNRTAGGCGSVRADADVFESGESVYRCRDTRCCKSRTAGREVHADSAKVRRAITVKPSGSAFHETRLDIRYRPNYGHREFTNRVEDDSSRRRLPRKLQNSCIDQAKGIFPLDCLS
jgi:hypothetical protein